MSTANWGAKKTSFFALSSNLMDDVSEIVILNENGYYLLLKVYSDCYRFSVLVTFHTKLKWTTEIFQIETYFHTLKFGFILYPLKDAQFLDQTNRYCT